MALGVTHAVAGALVGTLGSAWLGPDPFLVLAAVLGALLPDVDHPRSLLGRYAKSVSWLVRHRGFFHSFIAAASFAVLAAVLLRGVGVEASAYPLMLLAGYLSHLALDAWTREGVTPFYPAKVRVKGRRKVGSFLEYVLLALMGAAVLWFWLH